MNKAEKERLLQEIGELNKLYLCEREERLKAQCENHRLKCELERIKRSNNYENELSAGIDINDSHFAKQLINK